MRKIALIVCAALIGNCVALAESASDIIKSAQIEGGLVVHLGCEDGRLTAEMRLNDGYLVHGLDTDPKDVETARSRIKELGIYGKVSIDSFDGENLPYIDNVVNLLIAESLGNVSKNEVKRVLAPGGVALIGKGDKRKRIVKAIPGQTDEWTHYLHGPDNNAVSGDKAVSHPYHIQWVGLPKWTRNHNYLNSYSAVVSSGGRIFYILDEAPTHSVFYPSKWSLVARDAYNGIILWKKDVGPWEGHLRRFRSGPVELPRRLVACGNRVYVTLGYGKPVTALDAASGKAVCVYKETEGTHEIVYADGTLYLVAGRIDTQEYEKALQTASFSPPIRNKRILAVDAENGDIIWTRSDSDTQEMLPTTLCMDGTRVFFNAPNELVCLDRKSGQVEWKTPRPVEHKRLGWSAPTLVVYNNVVLSAEGKHGGAKGGSRTRRRAADAKPKNVAKTIAEPSTITWNVTSSPGSTEGGELIAFSAKDGKELWRCD
ncbi:MAG: outer membrane protein assembly factor BamB family protein, partial [Planctomycetota bacterium]